MDNVLAHSLTFSQERLPRDYNPSDVSAPSSKLKFSFDWLKRKNENVFCCACCCACDPPNVSSFRGECCFCSLYLFTRHNRGKTLPCPPPPILSSSCVSQILRFDPSHLWKHKSSLSAVPSGFCQEWGKPSSRHAPPQALVQPHSCHPNSSRHQPQPPQAHTSRNQLFGSPNFYWQQT